MIPNTLDPSAPGPWVPAWMAPFMPPPPITTGPGRYTSASNVWHIGMVCVETPQCPRPRLLGKADC